MRARGGAKTWQQQLKRNKRCEKGAACPFKHEHQHAGEYWHDEQDAPAAGAPKRHKSAADKKRDMWAAAGAGHVLDAAVAAPPPDSGPRCTYCRKAGHNILSCDAQGADAEKRRRSAKKWAKNAKKAAAVTAAPVRVGGGDVKVEKLPSALPPEYLNRMTVRAEPVAVRSTLRNQQDGAYEQALKDDLRRAQEAEAKEEEEQMAQLLEQSRIEVEEAEREKKKRRREELEREAPKDGTAGSVPLQFHLPDGSKVRRSFWSADQLDGAVAELLLVDPQLYNRRWTATQLPSREPLLASDASGRLTTAKPLSVGALGRAAIFVAYADDDD